MTCSTKRRFLFNLENLSCPQQQENGMVPVSVARCMRKNPSNGHWLLGGCDQLIIPFVESTSYPKITFRVMVLGQC